MRSHKKPLFITLLLVAILSFARADFEDIVTTITSVSTHPTTVNSDYQQTSMEGGSYLYIKGSGFSTRSPTSNIVTVGTEECPVVEFLTTSTQVVCILPPSATEGSAAVKVFVDENRIGTGGSIYYSYWLTPQLRYVSPNAANPGAQINYYGRQRVSSSNDIDYVKIGDRRCDASNQNEFTAVQFNGGSDQPGPCNIDAELEAGYYAVSQRNLKNTGVAKKLNTVPTYKFGGDAYDFLVAPAITSISSQVGSSEGQIITIKGSGFSGTAGQNEVSLAGTSCTILSESSSEIQCELGATSTPITEVAYHAGMKYETFTGSIDSVIAGTATRTSTGASLVGEIPLNSGERFSSKLSGFFKAPVTGNYRFVVTADDSARLYIDKTAGSTSTAEQIVSVSATSYRFPWVKGQTQESDDIALTAGSYYYLALYHQQYSGNSYATIGVRIPDTLNTVNPTPEVQSIAIDCPTVPEIIQFRVSNVNEGNWRIKFDYMSADGRVVEKTVKSDNLTFNAEAADVASVISSAFGLSTEVTRELFAEDETSTTDPLLAVTFVYDVTFKNLRKNGKLPSIDSADLKGSNPSGKVTQTQEPSPALSGNFTITYAAESFEAASDIQPWDLENKLRTLGFSDPIQVARYGDTDLGAEWRIQFTGDGSTDVVPLTVTSNLEGCSDPAAIQVNVATLQESSQNLYYEVIPSELLFTAHTTPQITVKSNGILGNCPGFNCNYALQSTGLPEVTARSFSGSTLSLTLANADAYTASDVKVFLGNTACTVSSFAAGSLTASCSAPEAGDHFPRVHFNGLGFASTSGISAIAISATVSSVSPSSINPNGGSILTVTGSGFPASLAIAQTRGLAVTIGSSACTLQSVTPTQIKCVSGVVASASALSVALNGKSGSSSSLSLIADVPTISSASPDNVNPVLQTDIVLTGTNFDATKDQTFVYLKSATNDKAAECLVSASSTTEITCKLLGAPTGTYSIYAQTSQGYTNSQPFTVETVITGISPSSGSIAGGTTLTITGGTFSDQTTQTLVFVGNGNDAVSCSVLSSTANQVTCVTGPLKTAALAESVQRIYVDTRIVETANCPNAADCQFTYSAAQTPQVSAIDASVVAGGSLTITGSGLDGTVTVTINGASVSVTSNTASQIVASIPNDIVPSETSAVVVNVAGKGNAQFDGGLSNVISVSPALASISQSTGSSAGVLLTITGAGFQQGASVTVGGTACPIRSLSATSITCKATSAGSVALAYDTFTNVQCSPSCSLAFDAAQTVTVGTISPLSPTSSTFTLTIPGTKFSIGTIRVALVSNFDSSISFIGSVTASTDTQITASFTNVAAGSYSVEVSAGNNLGSTTAVVNVPLTATPVAVDSSVGGGITATITGTGFFDNAQKDKNKVSVCGFPAEVLSSTPTSITYRTPLVRSLNLRSYFTLDYAPSLVKPSTTWSDAGNEAVLFDKDINTRYSSTNPGCQVGFDAGLDLQFELSEIGYMIDPLARAADFIGSQFQASNDNITWYQLFPINMSVVEGWNRQGFSLVRWRFIRFNTVTSNSKCALAEIYVKAAILSTSVVLVAPQDLYTCNARVAVNDKSLATGVAVNYKRGLTTTIVSFLTRVGPSSGGTSLLFRGSNFGAGAIVTVDGSACTVTEYTPTLLRCTTGPAPPIGQRALKKSNIRIEYPGKGYAVNNGYQFLYADYWSNPNTWGGLTPPREGESVSIPKGQNIILDISPPKLKAIIIEGGLIVENRLQTINLDAEYIMINGGLFQLGTEDEPLMSPTVTVTLHGNKDSPHLPIFGNKVIANMGGVLDINGRPRNYVWTTLDTTADVGSPTIVVQGSVDWQPGEVIVIASSNHDHYESEERTVVACQISNPGFNLSTVTLSEPLKFRHYAGVQTINGQTFEMRAEVGLLTRNIVIQGDETSAKNQYGVHIMSHAHHAGDDGAVGRISFTEVRQAGQAFQMGRYPIHFHLIGNVQSSYVRGNAVHHTYNRAITIHGVHQLRVERNVAYWVKGHTIFIEDGIETYNIIADNLVINTMASMSLLNTDQTPASFWITNPKNFFRGNRAAGSDRYGFWFDLREHPEGPSATDTVCPTGETLGEFNNNQAHSNGRYGLRIFHELIPRTNPCGPIEPYAENPPITAEFKNFLGWKNMRDAVIGERMGAITFSNIKAADNLRAGIEISDGDWSPPFTLQVKDSYIVGSTPDNGDTARYSENESKGLITPKKEYFIARNVQFSNFVGNMRAIETCSHCEHPAATTEGAITSYFEGLKFFNVEKKVKFNAPFREILVDNDGSLTGTNAKGVVTFFYPHLNVPGCTRNEAVYNGLVCDSTVTVRRIEFASLNPFDSFNMQFLDILNVENSANEPNYGSIAFRVKRYSWAAPFVTGFSYKLSWRSRADFNSLTVLPSKVIQTGDKAITLVFNHSEFRETYDLIGGSNSVNITNLTTLWAPQTAAANSKVCGDWYHDVQLQNLYVAVTPNVKQDVNVKAIKCRLNCPIPPALVEKDGLVRLWSDAANWPNSQVPQDGEDVEIPGTWTMKLDIPTASLKTLHVIGDLYFDETVDDLVLTAQNIWVEGQLFIGNSTDERFTKNAKIVLTGTRNTPGLIIGPVQDVSNKVLAVTGNVTMYGNFVNNVWVRLLASAAAGATTITVPSNVDWKVGDEIFIAPSQRAALEYESRTIQDITAGVITLDRALEFYHFGAASATKDTPFGTLDMRTEVGLLTRNIKIEGTDEDHWGGRLYVGEIYDPTYDYYFRGRADIDGIEMKNVGQANTTLAGLTFELLTTSNNADSVVKRSVVRNSQGYSLRVKGSRGVTIDQNIFFESYKFQLKFDGSNSNIAFTNNIGIGNRDRGLKADVADNSKDFIALFYSETNFVNSQISGNVFAGCEQHCFVARGGACATQPEGPWTASNNVAHSGETGWLVSDPSVACNGISHFTGYRLEQGIATFFKSQQIRASNIIIADTHIGLSLNTGGVLDDGAILLKDSYIAGVLTEAQDSYKKASECSNNAGIYVSVSAIGAKMIPPSSSMLPWYKVKSEHIWKSTFTVTGVTFENFGDGIVTGCTNNHLFASNPYASDNSASTFTSNLNLINVAADSLVFFNFPSDDWIGLDDCGGWYCTGTSNLVIKDTDGTLAGRPSNLIPLNKGVYDQTTCTSSTKQNAYICSEKEWGLLTFESMDIDFNTRLISPVYVYTDDGFTNKLNSYMDHGWDGFYTSLKRYSRFHSVVQAERDYKVNFTSTLPNGIRWQLQGAAATDSVTVKYGYTDPRSIRVTDKDGNVVPPKFIQSAAEAPGLTTSDECGAHIYEIDTRKITLKLNGADDCKLQASLVNSIQASIRYAVTIEEFFAQDGPTQFIDRVAAVLGINPASIRIVEIKSGSTIIKLFLDSNYQEETREHDTLAGNELTEWVNKLRDAAESGDLRILNSAILDYSFEMRLIREETPESINAGAGGTSTGTIIGIVVGVVVGSILIIGSFVLYMKYYRKRRLMAKQVAPIEFAQKKNMKNSLWVNTENPLNANSRIDASVDDKAANNKQSRPHSPSLSPLTGSITPDLSSRPLRTINSPDTPETAAVDFLQDDQNVRLKIKIREEQKRNSSRAFDL